MTYKTLTLDIENHIAHVSFNRPDKANALNELAWEELEDAFRSLASNREARVIMLSGQGKHFCAGIDLTLLMSIRQKIQNDCEGRLRENLRQMIFSLQAPINAIQACPQPVIALVHGACVGAGVDIVTACDMRYASQDAFFSIKEIDMGMVADIGTLQRLPKLIGDGIVREMAYTGRRVFAPEAERIHLINRHFADREALLAGVSEVAQSIASKSPLSIRGTKEVIAYSREHSIADGLNYIATWNAAMLLSQDLNEAFQATMEKREPSFEN